MSDRNLIDYLPRIFKNIREFSAIMEAEDYECDDINDAIVSLLDDQFIETVTDNSIAKYEKFYDVKPKDTATLEERRFGVMTKALKTIPYTKVTLEDSIKQLCGDDGYTLVISGYTVSVEVAVEAINSYDAVSTMLKEIMPANMLITLQQLYMTWTRLSIKIWGELSGHTWQEVREGSIS